MKKFIFKSAIIFIPVLLLHLIVFSYYSPDKGDLLRIGYIIDEFPEYRKFFSKDLENEMRVISVSKVMEKKEYDLLTIGDSFSEQGNIGYQNFLALNNGTKVVHVDRYFHTNQFQALIGLLNSGFFEKYKFNFVLLQFVEAGSRGIPRNLDLDYIYPEIKIMDSTSSDTYQFTKKFAFPSDRVVKFPYYNLKRILFPELDCNEVYSLPLKENAFSVSDSTLYFHSSNPAYSNNSDEQSIIELNLLLNQLAENLKEFGVELMIMPVPDKLDFYFDMLEYSGRFEKTKFFEIMAPLSKNYIYIDSFKILMNQRELKKDIYFYDDTHWSPLGAEIVSREISKIIIR